ncbi:MAG TPA: TetR family transcriptional regulator [Stellaceae bacterium]|nr:TetR family transcriptional regulator [Stellaceae bacterium]
MAKTAAGGRRRASADTGQQSDADRIIDATLARMASEGWRHLSLAAIADAAELPILRVYRAFGSKQAVLRGLYRRVDEAALAEPPPAEPAERPRDRLFDLLMRRFDTLQPYKPTLEVLRRELPGDPVTVLCAGASLLHSMRWMLEATHISTSGLRGALAVKLTAAAYLSTMRVWRRDDSPDLARTMAALDARLRRIERWLAPTDRPRRDEEPAPP